MGTNLTPGQKKVLAVLEQMATEARAHSGAHVGPIVYFAYWGKVRKSLRSIAMSMDPGVADAVAEALDRAWLEVNADPKNRGG